MTKGGIPKLRTSRLILSDLLDSDVDEIMFLRSDPVVNKFVKRPKPQDTAETLDIIHDLQRRVREAESYFWRICLKENFVLIGTICLWNFSRDRKTVEMGFDLHPNFHRKGFMNEALIEVLNFGFNELQLDEIEAFTHTNNRSSIKLLERNGFLIKKDKKDKDDENNVVYGLMRRGKQHLTSNSYSTS